MQVQFYPPRLTDHEVRTLQGIARRSVARDRNQVSPFGAWLYSWTAKEQARREAGINDITLPVFDLLTAEQLASALSEVQVILAARLPLTRTEEDFLFAVSDQIANTVTSMLSHLTRGGRWDDVSALYPEQFEDELHAN